MTEHGNLSLEALAPTIAEVIGRGGTFSFVAQGTSMLPTVIGGSDIIEISAAGDISLDDIVFYRRANGQFVLHRVVGADEQGFIMCGDNQTVLEKGITREMIIARLVAVRRGQERIEYTPELLGKSGRKAALKRTYRLLRHKLGAPIKKLFKKK